MRPESHGAEGPSPGYDAAPSGGGGPPGGDMSSSSSTSSTGGSKTSPLLSTVGSGVWGAPALPTAPLLGTERTLLNAKKERLSRGTRLLMPYWAVRQVVINPVTEEETCTPAPVAAPGGCMQFVSLHSSTRLLMPYWAVRQVVINPVTEEETCTPAPVAAPGGCMQFSLARLLCSTWRLLSRPTNLWLMVTCILSFIVYGCEKKCLLPAPQPVMLLLGAPLLLLLSVAAFAGRHLQASSRREAIAA
ncbi:uncharacterized protein EMH_0038150 [Eimeria mitis]|uniref:Uncharacterized protein n=1 Tax=Eimeria mitis TaxID=44415 RepID=U6JRR3_9EIME|nr:uncharacterized protein EMH_0038150 [Eimeria mitis]CDJ28124.1 hypothetical protein EMH_0038150 [Eimeria mitis]